jgi:hypothetical protein
MMYIVLAVNSDVKLLSSLKDALKERFPLIPFSISEPKPNEFKLILEGKASDEEPRKFVKEFFGGDKKSKKREKKEELLQAKEEDKVVSLSTFSIIDLL